MTAYLVYIETLFKPRVSDALCHSSVSPFTALHSFIYDIALSHWLFSQCSKQTNKKQESEQQQKSGADKLLDLAMKNQRQVTARWNDFTIFVKEQLVSPMASGSHSEIAKTLTGVLNLHCVGHMYSHFPFFLLRFVVFFNFYKINILHKIL